MSIVDFPTGESIDRVTLAHEGDESPQDQIGNTRGIQAYREFSAVMTELGLPHKRWDQLNFGERLGWEAGAQAAAATVGVDEATVNAKTAKAMATIRHTNAYARRKRKY